MTMQRVGKVLVVAVVLLLVAACGRSASVYNVKDAGVVTNFDSPSSEEIGRAIVRAGADLGWRMREQEDGHIIGTLNIRDHRAEVDVYYDTESYSIEYRDSHNLNYDGQTIHRDYNGWIQNLDERINSQLLAL